MAIDIKPDPSSKTYRKKSPSSLLRVDRRVGRTSKRASKALIYFTDAVPPKVPEQTPAGIATFAALLILDWCLDRHRAVGRELDHYFDTVLPRVLLYRKRCQWTESERN